MKKVAGFLRVDHRPEATLLANNEKQHSGSCQWLTDHPTFLEWVDETFEDWEEIDPLTIPPENLRSAPPVLWLHGRPGTGKSVATGHVTRYLQSCNFDCSFYFFRHEDRATSNFASLLRSLAFQMAETSIEIRRAIVSMADEGVPINKDDHHLLLTKLFKERILKANHVGPQYWVIDAVDECSNKTMPALISMLSNLDFNIPIRVFMTSRPGGEVGKHMSAAQPSMSFLEMTTGEDGSLKDIELFLQSWCARSGDAYQGLIADVLAKSNGIFLWASLTIAKLEDVYSVEDRQDVLEQIPPEMDEFYSRIITSVAESQSSDLAKCVLTWVICSPKPLHLTELTEAVKVDMGRTLTASARQLETMTGHLIFVDEQMRVRIAHETMSRFLTQPKDHAFWVDRTAANTRIAEICLKVLCGPDFAPPRMRRGRAAMTTRDGPTQSLLADYAALNFSHFLIHGSSVVDSTLLLLNQFLRSNVLTWIERIASMGDLWPLQQTVQRLKSYLSRRAKYQSPVSIESRTVAAWASDIYHIVSAFHSSLLACPSSVHFIIPHLCPLNSIIRELFAKPNKRLRIAGPLEEDWNDRLACCLLPEPSSITCSSRLVAIGLFSGDINLYNFANSGAFHSVGTLEHGKKVRQVAFNRTSSILASASARQLMLWDLRASGEKGTPLWSKNLDFTPFSLAFTPDDRSVVLTYPGRSAIITFNVDDANTEEPLFLHSVSDSDSTSSGGSNSHAPVFTPSERMALDPDMKLAAMAYRNAVVTIWDISVMECIGNFEKEGCEDGYWNAPVIDMVFNPMSELELLAITYKDGEIVTCNPWTLDTENVFKADVLLESLAATSDGRVLAGAAEDGRIYLFLFETLQPIYQIARPDSQLRINNLAFSKDNLRLFDIRGHSCNVWEPQVLIPRDGGDDTSSEPHSEEIFIPEAPASNAHSFQWGKGITAVDSTTDGRVLFVGRRDGSIDICEVDSGEAIDKIRLSFAKIRLLEWNESKSCLLSLDMAGRYMVNRLTSFSKKGTKAEVTTLLDGREQLHGVRQALLNPAATSVLLCTDADVKLISLDGTVIAPETSLTGESWWISHPGDPTLLVSIQNETVHLYDWGSLEQVTPSVSVTLQLSLPEPPILCTATGANPWMLGNGSGLVAAQGLLMQSQQRLTNLVALDTAKLSGATQELPLQVLGTHTRQLNPQHLIGCLKSLLFFLDTGGWVCSINLKSLKDATHYTRHFFIPLSWRTSSDAVVKVVSKSALVFARGEQLIVFHGFLEFEEKVSLERINATI